jgi:ribosome biogenesis GTPase A
MKSNQSNVASITDLQDEAIRLIDLQKEILKKIGGSKHLVSQNIKSDSNKSSEFFTKSAIDIKINVLEDHKTKTENLEMVLAVVGTMKAGKSTTINAIVGREILPNRNRPMTALPTRIRHVNGRTSPVLRFKKYGPIQELVANLKKIQSTKVDEKINNDENLKKVFTSLRENQILHKEYKDEKEIFEFLAHLNDLVRLSAALGVDFPFEQYTSIEDFPLIEVEFFSLRDLDHSGIGRFTMLDTPGFNEHGQQEKLQPMVWEQLKKATAVLAVLDYTQLKSESEGVLREELENTAEVAEGRMFALINKFDQKDRNSSDEKETKKYVAEHLLANTKIKPEYIFLASSRNAYLAKKAQLALSQPSGLVWHESQAKSWIEDFAELAFGKRWQKQINDSDEVKEAAAELWEESMLDKLLKGVIQYGYISAAPMAIEAATAILTANAEKTKEFIDGRLQMLDSGDKELQAAISEVNAQIESLHALQKKSERDLHKRIQALNSQVEQGLAVASQDAHKVISEFLKKGIINTKKIIHRELEEYLKHHDFYKKSKGTDKEIILNDLLNLLPSNLNQAQSILEQLRHKKYNKLDVIRFFFTSHKIDETEKNNDNTWPTLVEKLSQRKHFSKIVENKIFDPEMVYESKEGVEAALAEISEQVTGILKSTQASVGQQLEAARDQWQNNMHSLHNEVSEQVKQFSADANDWGLSALSFSAPSLPKLHFDKNKPVTPMNLIEDKSRKVTRRCEQSGGFGWLKRKLNFFNGGWGYDEYQRTENRFVIKINELENHWNGIVKQSLDALTSTVENDFSHPIQESSDEFFTAITERFEEVAENLQSGLKNHTQSLDTQNKIKQELQLLKKLNHPSLQDMETLSSAVKHQANYLKQTTTTGRDEWVN